jgi:hypothetical protein
MLSLNSDASRTSAHALLPMIATANSTHIFFIEHPLLFFTYADVTSQTSDPPGQTVLPVRPENGPSIRLLTPAVNAGRLRRSNSKFG